MSDTFEDPAGERRAGEDRQRPAEAVSETAPTRTDAPSQLKPTAHPAKDVDRPQPVKRGPSTWRAFRDPLLVGILLAAIIADQVTKQIVLNSLDPGGSWPDSGFFRFTFVRNDGTAFGLFQDSGILLTLVSLGAVALIIYFYREAAMASWFTRAALGLQLGGAAGNLIDRFRHGYVVDFIDVGTWPIFNVADSSIMVGIISLVAYFTLLGGRDRPIGAPPDDASLKTEAIEDSALVHPGDTAVSDTVSDARHAPPTAEGPVSSPEPRD